MHKFGIIVWLDIMAHGGHDLPNLAESDVRGVHCQRF
jgi:hypothetical protein